ncbi:preprotein translocase subunit SecE [Klenkia sp. LSe6-5]|uniref:Protein translocase subunit SecE n=1 Tax=Klenkia sesuvii TaxID=3103137 RepID=A0ABU8DQL1_9ACTN
MSDEQPGTEDERVRRRPGAEPADDADRELTDEQIDAEAPGVDDAAELEAAEAEVAEEAAEAEDKVVAPPTRRRRGAITADDDEGDEPEAPRVRRRDRPGGRPASEARTTRPARGDVGAVSSGGAGKGEGTRTRAEAERARAAELREKRSIGRFLREVVAELRKVIWPGRRELITYTTVVIVFVAFMVALVAGLDILFAQGVIAVFG